LVSSWYSATGNPNASPAVTCVFCEGGCVLCASVCFVRDSGRRLPLGRTTASMPRQCQNRIVNAKIRVDDVKASMPLGASIHSHPSLFKTYSVLPSNQHVASTQFSQQILPRGSRSKHVSVPTTGHTCNTEARSSASLTRQRASSFTCENDYLRATKEASKTLYCPFLLQQSFQVRKTLLPRNVKSY
jgi:hypothetical protein